MNNGDTVRLTGNVYKFGEIDPRRVSVKAGAVGKVLCVSGDEVAIVRFRRSQVWVDQRHLTVVSGLRARLHITWNNIFAFWKPPQWRNI